MSLIISLLIIGVVAYIAVRANYENSVGGELVFREGREYAFKTGDMMQSYDEYGRFNGLDLRLQIELPHIYLDSLKSGGRRVSAVFDSSQRIVLEGDFNQYFNVFVPEHYEAVALSIITPDVMETLQKYAADFDVEIYGDHLRVISNRRVSKDSELLGRMIEVAEKILKEIEDRERSWTESNTLAAIDQDLRIYPSPGYRIFGRYITRARLWLSVFWFFVMGDFLFLAIYLFINKRYAAGVLILGVAIAGYTVLQLFTASSQSKIRFWSRRG